MVVLLDLHAYYACEADTVTEAIAYTGTSITYRLRHRSIAVSEGFLSLVKGSCRVKLFKL